ncbi:MAG: restriction endonuclease [Chloroflexi bacterium]|nr:restriction endonuclease [Chloroflexota bacterium]
MKPNALYYGDNLIWLRNHDKFPGESVDLIYLDPPFNSNADYNVIFQEPGGEESQAQLRAFGDTWGWDSEASALALQELSNEKLEAARLIEWIANRGDKSSKSMAAYIGMMATRLLELYRVLKTDGSIYLHCDSTASHYLKMLMDTIFGMDNFRNEIVWKRFNFHADAKRFGRVSDRILFYTKGDNYRFNRLRTDFSEEYIESKFTHYDPDGRRFRLDNLNPPAGRGPVYKYHGVTKAWRFTKDKMLQFEAEGKIYTDSKVPQLKRYLDELEGQAIHDMWIDISPINSQAKERLGYPTQKPLALLERIIQASSSEGNVVLDPFCGCGTALVAAHKLNRKWIGIDITYLSIDLVEQRLIDSFGEVVRTTYSTYGDPQDVKSAQALWEKDAKEFELWAIRLIGARPRPKDGGVDGVLGFIDKDRKVQKIVVQVKGGETLNPGMVRDLIGTVEKEKAAIGLLITLHKPTSGMTELAVHAGVYKSEFWNKSYPRIQVHTIQELLVEGKQFDLPPQVSTLKRAERVREQGRNGKLL